jgi:hypothetical protein
MVVVYRLSSLTYMLGKPFVKVDTYAMANLVAGTRVVPELIQNDFTPDRVADETIAMLTDRDRYERIRSALGHSPSSSWRARSKRARCRCGAGGRTPRREICIAEPAMNELRPRRICAAVLMIAAFVMGTRVSALTLLPADFSEMVNGSQQIIHGRVVDVRAQAINGRRSIESVVTVAVIESFKGSTGSEVAFRMPNGELGRISRVLIGVPEFEAGAGGGVVSGRPCAGVCRCHSVSVKGYFASRRVPTGGAWWHRCR